MKTRYYILTFFVLCANLLFAQVKFTSSVDRTTVGTGEQFEVTFSLNGNGSDFTPPNFDNFQVLSGPNVSTSMTSINGSTTMSNSYSFDLMPIKVGNYTIGPASITVNGRRLTTSAISIKVIKGHTVPQNNQAQAAGPPDNSAASANVNLAKSLFIKADVDRTNVYQGQQLIVTYKVYTSVGIEDSQVDVIPSLNGFWSEDVKQGQQTQWRVETYEGRQYNVADIKQTILFPEHAGNLTIDPLGMTFVVRVQVPSRDFMDQFFGNFKEVNYKAKSLPVTIHVKPLPEAGKPESFAGAVGKFNIESSVDKTELKANDALNYRVKLTGSGNIKLLNNLNVNFPPDFEKYDPKITDTVTEDGSGLSGSRSYSYLLIPRHQGDFNIDPLKFSYFNPSTGRYVNLATRSFHIKVDKGSAESNVTAFSDADKEDIKMLGQDIRYIKTEDTGMIRQGGIFFGSALYYVLLLAGPAACYGAFVYRNRLIKNNSDLVRVRSRRAGKLAAKHLASAQKQLQAGNSKSFYEDVSKGLYGYLSDKLNIQYANLDRETIAGALKARSLKPGLTGRLLDTLDLCEMARYAPVNHISEKEVFERAKGIISDIENEI